MRITALSFLIILIGYQAYAEDFFLDSAINDLQVIMVDEEQGSAWIRDSYGQQVEVSIGDKIGVEETVVVQIEEAFIIVQSGQSRTKIPLQQGDVFTKDASSEKVLLPAPSD